MGIPDAMAVKWRGDASAAPPGLNETPCETPCGLHQRGKGTGEDEPEHAPDADAIAMVLAGARDRRGGAARGRRALVSPALHAVSGSRDAAHRARAAGPTDLARRHIVILVRHQRHV